MREGLYILGFKFLPHTPSCLGLRPFQTPPLAGFPTVCEPYLAAGVQLLSPATPVIPLACPSRWAQGGQGSLATRWVVGGGFTPPPPHQAFPYFRSTDFFLGQKFSFGAGGSFPCAELSWVGGWGVLPPIRLSRAALAGLSGWVPVPWRWPAPSCAATCSGPVCPSPPPAVVVCFAAELGSAWLAT